MAKKVTNNDDPISNAVLTGLDLLRIGATRLWRRFHPIKAPFGSLALGTAHPLWLTRDTAPFWITRDERARHVYVLGASGAGKTKALESWIRQDLVEGRGVGVLDLHGDLTRSLLGFLAMSSAAGSRTVYLLDPSARTAVPGFNPLEVPNGAESFGQMLELLGVFKKIWAEFWGPRMEEILRNSLLALMEERLTLLELQPFLTDREFRLRVVGKLQNAGVREFWLARFERLSRGAQAAYVEPVLNKAGAFTSDPYLRALLGQERSTINLRRIMDRGDVLLVNLAKGQLKENALLLGALLVAKLQLAALSRSLLPEGRRRSFHLFIDEFQNFATDTFGEILAEARKYGLSLTVAHQHLDQLPSDLRAALLGNVHTEIVFQVSLKDAKALAPELSYAYREPVERTLIGLPSRQAIARRKSDPTLGLPWLLTTFAIDTTKASAADVKRVTEEAVLRSATPRSKIEEAIQARWARLGIHPNGWKGGPNGNRNGDHRDWEEVE
jgi:hypothetical protein